MEVHPMKNNKRNYLVRNGKLTTYGWRFINKNFKKNNKNFKKNN